MAAALALGNVGCQTETKPGGTEPRVRIDAERYRVDLFEDDHALGGEQPLVTVVVFTDYACPPCGRTWQVMDHLVEDYGADLRVVYRAYTVPGFGRGEQAAEAAYAAGAQGKFWDMHRRLFAQGGQFDRPTLRALAEELGLDVPRFLDDIDTGSHSGQRVRHRRQAKALGVTGLPASFVNGLYLPGYADEAAWHGVIDEEIRRARGLLAQGTPRAQVYEAFMKSASTKQVGSAPGEQALREELAAKPNVSATPKRLTPPDPSKRYSVRVGDALAAGAEDAPVEIVMFFDFRCPFCRRAWQQELGVLVRSQPEGIRLGVRQLPLEIHPEARGAALAGLAAARQGRFWGMFDALVEHEGPLGRSDFMAYAKALELDLERFGSDLDDPGLAEQLAADVALADRAGVTGTPGFFINGRYISGFNPGALSRMIEEEQAVAQERIDSGIPRHQVVDAILQDAAPLPGGGSPQPANGIPSPADGLPPAGGAP
ncbi:DsbA family protein [Paraliomyxa miuraensis]|uniref:DsbA family protein n=1 Tax=Paraliomyxa miuraensis TaxID=376150 RepID=UPI00225C1DB8|nr:DsbA family protein [Paraliomyxa miuraensis]MCX4239874.1 thioredoxin domain-containing protein [Paraliomyxa miuraensis]